MLTLDLSKNEMTNVFSTMSSIYKMSSFLVQFLKINFKNNNNEK